jgi:hypothetical protein
VRIVIAPDSFKGSASALAAANAMALGSLAVFPRATVGSSIAPCAALSASPSAPTEVSSPRGRLPAVRNGPPVATSSVRVDGVVQMSLVQLSSGAARSHS